VDPIDYESVIAKNKTLLQNDPQREMLIFPHDDVSVSSRARWHFCIVYSALCHVIY